MKSANAASRPANRRLGGRPGPLSSISLLSLLAACGGGGGGPGGESPPVTLSGQVVKGHVEGAAVFLDRDGDGLPDPGDEPVFTDAEGRYSLEVEADADGTIIAIGGVDTLTNVPLEGTIFKAPADATVVTPLTTLVAELAETGGMSVDEAVTQVLDAFDLTLPAGTDLLDYDPQDDLDGAGAAAEDASEVVLNTILSVQSILEGAQVEGAAEKALASIATTIGDGAQIDWSDANVIETILDQVFEDNGLGASNKTDLTELAQAVARVNGTLGERSGVDEDALSATRFALSDFQDLMKQVGAGAQLNTTDPEDQFLDISFNEQGVKDDVEEVADDPDTVIETSGETTLSFEVRQEDDDFTLALRPELKLVDGIPAEVENITLRFLQAGVVVERVTISSEGELRETLFPDGGGVYDIDYDDLDKIQITPPEDFNGELRVEIGLSYAGIEDEPPRTFTIDIAAVNDAPEIAEGEEAQVFAGSSNGVFAPDGVLVGNLFTPALDDTRDHLSTAGGSDANGLAGVAILANAAVSSQGTWQYSIDGGTQWADLPGVSADAAFILAADARIRFYPTESFRVGSPGVLTAHLIDDSAGDVTSGEVVDLSAAGALGGGTAFSADTVSATASLDIAFIDAPVVSEAIADGISAAEAAAGVPVTLALTTSTAVAGDSVELLLGDDSFAPPILKEVTVADITAGEIVLTLPQGSLGVDGAKTLAAKLIRGGDGGSFVSSSIQVVLDTQAPDAPVLTLESASDTGVRDSDGLTNDSTPTLRITLPAGIVAGDRVDVLVGTAVIGSTTVTEADVTAGGVDFTMPSALSDGPTNIGARITDEAGNVSELSEELTVVVDTGTPASPTLDQVDGTIAGEEAEAFVVSGTATEGSSVEVTLTGAGGDPIVLTLNTDPAGRFHAQMDLTSVASDSGDVSISVLSRDAAGNPSAATGLAVVVGEENTAVTHPGTQHEVVVQGTAERDVFAPEEAINESFFLGGDGFDSLSMTGLLGSEVRISRVPESNRADLETVLQAEGASQDLSLPLWRVSELDGSAEFFIQAEEVIFADGTARLTSDGVIADDGGAVLSGGFGSEHLVGGSGDDRLFGGDGDDTLIGNDGDDVLVSQGGNDVLVGGLGDDLLVVFGDAGANESPAALQGGAGDDVFVIAPSEGFARDVTIQDFFVGEDLIDLSAFHVDDGGVRSLTSEDIDFAALSAALETDGFFEIDFSEAQLLTSGGDALDGGLRVELEDLSGTSVSAGDFIFATIESPLTQDPSIEAHAALVIVS